MFPSGRYRAISRIERARHDVAVGGGRAFNMAWQDWLNLDSQLTAARLIVMSGLERRESRGAHYRRDFSESGGELYTVRVWRVGDEPALRREPVLLTRATPSPRAPVTVDIGE